MSDAISWIKTISYEDADSNLKSVFDQCRGPNGQLDNLYKAYSLMPHSLGPADDLYKAVLHNQANALPKWQAELIATYVAILENCAYAKSHHGNNFLHLYPDPEQAKRVLNALESDGEFSELDEKTTAVLIFTRELAESPTTMSEANIVALRSQNFVDREILEIVQIVACFGYFTRVINALGIALGDEISGYYGDLRSPEGQK